MEHVDKSLRHAVPRASSIAGSTETAKTIRSTIERSSAIFSLFRCWWRRRRASRSRNGLDLASDLASALLTQRPRYGQGDGIVVPFPFFFLLFICCRGFIGATPNQLSKRRIQEAPRARPHSEPRVHARITRRSIHHLY